MILRISFRAKAGVPKTLLKRKLRLYSLYFPQNTLMLTESPGLSLAGSLVFCILFLDFAPFAIADSSLNSVGSECRLEFVIFSQPMVRVTIIHD